MFAVTERLLLRPGWAEDAPELAQAIGDPAVAPRLARVPWPYGLADAEAFLALPQNVFRPRFLICLRTDNRIVGGIGLSGDEEAELGYWIARDHWNRGYATEAGRALLAMADATLRLPRIKAHHAIDNCASGAVLSKLGFEPRGTGWMPSLARGRVEARLMVREREVPYQALAA